MELTGPCLSGGDDESLVGFDEAMHLLPEVGNDLAALGEFWISTDGISREGLAEVLTALAGHAERVRMVLARGLLAGSDHTVALTKGESTPAAMLNQTTRVKRSDSNHLQNAAATARRFKSFNQAYFDGEITSQHLTALETVAKAVDPTALAYAADALCELAKLCTPEEFTEALAVWRNQTDEADHYEEHLQRQGEQQFNYAYTLFGSVLFSGVFGPETAEACIEAIRAKAKELSGSSRPSNRDQGDALADLIQNLKGRPGVHIELIAPANNNADAGDQEGTDEAVDKECCADEDCDEEDHGESGDVWPHAEPVGGGVVFDWDPSWLNSVTPQDPRNRSLASIRYPKTRRGTPIPPRRVAEWIAHGAKVTVHWVGADGQLLNDQNDNRRFNARQERLIRLRDNRCQHPGCNRYLNLDIDHIHPHSRGGPTKVANAQLLCRLHHRWKHRNDPHGSTIFKDSPIQQE